MISQKNLLMVVLLLLQIADTNESECSAAAESENIPHIRMCEDGSVMSDKVILDTHGAAATGETTCLCSVNSTQIALVDIEHYGYGLNPNTSGCGSEVVAFGALDKFERKYKCNTSPEPTWYVAIPTTNLTWNGVPRGDSKYCLNITGLVSVPNTTFTITCFKPTTPTTPRPTPPTTTTSIPSTTKPTPPTTSTTTYVSRTNTDTTFTKRDVTRKQTTETPATGCDEEGYLYLPVYAFVIIITLMCLITLYATVVTFLYLRRYLTSKNHPQNDITTGATSGIPLDGGYVNMQLPPATDRTYEGLELSQVNLTPNTYELFRNHMRDESVTVAHQH